MKINYISVVILIIFPYILYAQNMSKLDEKNGFKNFIFGSDVKSYKNLTYDGSLFSKYNQEFTKKFDGYIDFDLKAYHIEDENAKIGDLSIGRPTYYFFNSKPLRVDFYLDNWQGKEMLQLYNSLYGNPRIVYEKNVVGADVTTYLWQGNKVSLSLSFCKNPYQGSVSSSNNTKPPQYFVRYLSIPLLAQKKSTNIRNKIKANQNRAGDL